MSAAVDPCVLVYDVGGSHISAAVCYKEGFRLGPVVRANQPTEQTSEAFIEVLYSLGEKTAVSRRKGSPAVDKDSYGQTAIPGRPYAVTVNHFF